MKKKNLGSELQKKREHKLNKRNKTLRKRLYRTEKKVAALENTIDAILAAQEDAEKDEE